MASRGQKARLPLKPGEKLFLDDYGVMVTSSRFVIFRSGQSPRTIATRLIASVECEEVSTEKETKAAWDMILGGLILLMCCGIGIFLIPIGLWQLNAIQTRWALVLHTAGAPQQYLKSSDRDEIEDIVDAISKAIVSVE